jgi:hypothetical protein
MAKAAAKTKNKLTGPWKGESNIRSTSKVDIVKRIVKRSGSPGRAQGVSGVCAQQHEPKSHNASLPPLSSPHPLFSRLYSRGSLAPLSSQHHSLFSNHDA